MEDRNVLFKSVHLIKGVCVGYWGYLSFRRSIGLPLQIVLNNRVIRVIRVIRVSNVACLLKVCTSPW